MTDDCQQQISRLLASDSRLSPASSFILQKKKIITAYLHLAPLDFNLNLGTCTPHRVYYITGFHFLPNKDIPKGKWLWLSTHFAPEDILPKTLTKGNVTFSPCYPKCKNWHSKTYTYSKSPLTITFELQHDKTNKRTVRPAKTLIRLGG